MHNHVIHLDSTLPSRHCFWGPPPGPWGQLMMAMLHAGTTRNSGFFVRTVQLGRKWGFQKQRIPLVTKAVDLCQREAKLLLLIRRVHYPRSKDAMRTFAKYKASSSRPIDMSAWVLSCASKWMQRTVCDKGQHDENLFLTQNNMGAGPMGAEGHDTNRQRVKLRSDPVTMTEFSFGNELYLITV